MEDHTIEQVRTATFKEARRGYERREVDSFLAGLADWLEEGGSDQVRSETVKRELERVGEKTSNILSAAEDTAEKMRREADADSRQTIEAGQAKSRRIVQEGEQRRADIEAVIADLVRRRDAVLGEIERLEGQLHAAVAEHRPKGADPFAPPTVLDPAERGAAAPSRDKGEGAPAEEEQTQRPSESRVRA